MYVLRQKQALEKDQVSRKFGTSDNAEFVAFEVSLDGQGTVEIAAELSKNSTEQ